MQLDRGTRRNREVVSRYRRRGLVTHCLRFSEISWVLSTIRLMQTLLTRPILLAFTLLLLVSSRSFGGVDAIIVDSTANRMTVDAQWGHPSVWDGDYEGLALFFPSHPGEAFGYADVIYFPWFSQVLFDFMNHSSFIPQANFPPILSGAYGFLDPSDPTAEGGTWYYTDAAPSITYGVFSTPPSVFPFDGDMPAGSPPIGLTTADAYGARFVFGEPYSAVPLVPEGNLFWAWIPMLAITGAVALRRRIRQSGSTLGNS